MLSGHEGQVRIAAFSPDGRWLVSGSSDRTARIWDLHAADPSVTAVVVRGHSGPVTALAISPDSQWFATASGDAGREADYTVRLWDLGVERLADVARAAARRELDPRQRSELLIEAAKRSDSRR